jgi:hypothetical protein
MYGGRQKLLLFIFEFRSDPGEIVEYFHQQLQLFAILCMVFSSSLSSLSIAEWMC